MQFGQWATREQNVKVLAHERKTLGFTLTSAETPDLEGRLSSQAISRPQGAVGHPSSSSTSSTCALLSDEEESVKERQLFRTEPGELSVACWGEVGGL